MKKKVRLLSTDELREKVEEKIREICEGDRVFEIIDFQKQLPVAVAYTVDHEDHHQTCFYSITLTGFDTSHDSDNGLRIEISWQAGHNSNDSRFFSWDESAGWQIDDNTPIEQFRIILPS